MSSSHVELSASARLAGLAQRVLAGGGLTRSEGHWIFPLRDAADIPELLTWANRIRHQFKGNKIHLCSIVNIKAGGCSENCRFCAQSSAYSTESPRYDLIPSDPILQAAAEAKANGVTALG